MHGKESPILRQAVAELYGVTTKVFNQAVKRNIDRFPKDFMLQLTAEEVLTIRSQFVTASTRNKNGVAMQRKKEHIGEAL